MTRSRLFVGVLAVGGLFGVLACGCSKQHMIDCQLKAARESSPAIDTLSDYSVAMSSQFAELGQLEKLHRLSPENADGLLMLAKGWTWAGFAYIEDDWESAVDFAGDDDELAQDARLRAQAAYTRAVHYGVELLEQHAQGFEIARRTPDSIRAWLNHFDADQVSPLYWTSLAWILRSRISPDIPEYADQLFVGLEMMTRVIQLDNGAMLGMAHATLGSSLALLTQPQLDLAKKHFDDAVAASTGKLLMVKVLLARTYFCGIHDRNAYVTTLQQVLAARDPLPEQRLSNTIAKRRATRYLGDARMDDCDF